MCAAAVAAKDDVEAPLAGFSQVCVHLLRGQPVVHRAERRRGVERVAEYRFLRCNE